jgi:hypothetical protein
MAEKKLSPRRAPQNRPPKVEVPKAPPRATEPPMGERDVGQFTGAGQPPNQKK